jgi:hypothetical protein
MSISKIQFKIGPIEFTGEGEPEWVSSQLDKLITMIPELLTMAQVDQDKEQPTNGNEPKPRKLANKNIPSNLSVFLREKNAVSNQNKKFLATSAFLQLNGKNRLSTSDITKALKDANQTKLGNPSESLNQNVKKGHCEKDGPKEYFVTSHGFEDLSIPI